MPSKFNWKTYGTGHCEWLVAGVPCGRPFEKSHPLHTVCVAHWEAQEREKARLGDQRRRALRAERAAKVQVGA
jgi:hypothetical protein